MAPHGLSRRDLCEIWIQRNQKIHIQRNCLERPPRWPQKCGLSRQVVSGDRFSYIEMYRYVILPKMCGLSTQVVSHANGLSRQVSLYRLVPLLLKRNSLETTPLHKGQCHNFLAASTVYMCCSLSPKDTFLIKTKICWHKGCPY